MRAYLIGHLNKFVGGLTHRRNDRHDTMTTAMQIGETARDRADFCRCFKTGAAVFCTMMELMGILLTEIS